MAQIFATRVWGADLDRWPLATFGKAGHRDSLLRRAQEQSYICFVGTNNTNTSIENRGKILALAEFSREPVDAESILIELNGQLPLPADNFDADGRFKWPFALCLTRAWKIDPPVSLRSVLGRQLTMNATPGAEELSPDEVERVLRLPVTEVVLPELSAIRALRLQEGMEGGDAQSIGLPPHVGGFHVTRERKKASVYILRFGETDVFKLGWASNVQQRLHDINNHIPHEILNLSWKLFLVKDVDDQFTAFRIEQSMFNGIFRQFRTVGERLRCAPNKLRDLWATYSWSI